MTAVSRETGSRHVGEDRQESFSEINAHACSIGWMPGKPDRPPESLTVSQDQPVLKGEVGSITRDVKTLFSCTVVMGIDFKGEVADTVSPPFFSQAVGLS